MRILFEIISLEVAGAQKMVVDLACFFKREGYDVCVLVLSEDPNNHLSKRLKDCSIRVEYVCVKRNRIKNAIRRYYSIKRVITDFDPEIVHGHLDYRFLWLYALFHRIYIVETFHSQSFRLNRCTFKLLYSLLMWKKRIVPVCLTNSNALEFSALYKTKIEDIYVISNPLELRLYEPHNKKCIGHTIRFCFASRFHDIKRHDILLKAFKLTLRKCDNSELILAGDGNTRRNIELLANNLGISDKVLFLGEVSNVQELLKDVDIGVISSDSESFSLFLIECMAMQIPVVVTRVGGMRDIVDGNGLLVDKGNIVQMAEAMIELANNMELRHAMGKKGRELVEKYDLPRIAYEYRELYKKVIK